jgi:hypothetical protein
MAARVVERHLDELVGAVGQEELAESLIAGAYGEPGVPVVGLGDRDQSPPLRGVSRGLERDVDGFAAAAAVDDLCESFGSAADQSLRERCAGHSREVVVADVEVRHRLGDRGNDLGVAVAQVVGASIEVHVEQPLALTCHR